MTWPIGIGIAVAMLLVGALVLRLRAESPWLGPLFWYELVKLARRGSQPRLRAVYAGLLLIGLLVTYLQVFSDHDPVSLLFDSTIQLPQNQRSTFTEAFTFAYFLVQLIAVSLITPVYAGGAIAEEKDRKSLDFLQSSLLSNREIVLGKLAARLTFVTCIALVGLPILFMTMLFGGLDENTIITGFILSFFTMLGLAGFSLLMGVYRKTLRDALYWPYGILVVTTAIGFILSCCFPWFSFLSPFTALSWTFMMNASGGMLGGPWGITGVSFSIFVLTVFCTIYGLVFLICTTLAIYRIRPAIIEPRFDPDTGRRRSPRPSARAKIVSAERVVAKPAETATTIDFNNPQLDPYEPPPPRRPRTVRARRAFTVPPLRDADPFLWKERYFSGRLPVLESGVAWGCALAVIITFLSGIGIVLFAGVLVQVLNGKMPGEVVNWCMRVFCVGTIIGLAPVIGLRAASSITKERSQQTLLSLFVVPEARGRILMAKWMAPLYGVRYWLIALAASIIVTLFSGGIHPLGVIAGLAYLIGFIPFANSLGLWLSVKCKTGTRAATIFLGTMLALMIGPPMFGTLLRALLQVVSNSASGALAENFLDNVNPIVGIWRAFAAWDDVAGNDGDPFGQRARMTAIPALLADTIIGFLYLLAAIWFGWRTKKAFDNETA